MNRIEKVQKKLANYQIDALIVDRPIDLYYLTGLDFSLGRLLITPEGATLFVDGRYFEYAKKKLFFPVVLSTSFEALWNLQGKRVGFDGDFTTYASYKELQKLNSEWISLESPIKWMRSVKEEEEIGKLRKAAHLCSLGYDHILSFLQEGITELDLGKELELFWLKNGGEKLAFPYLIAFGENGAYPHHRSGTTRLKKGDGVLIDIGVVADHYYSDMTRVVFFGEPSSEMEKIYHIVRQAQSRALQLCRPGSAVEKIDRAAREWIAEQGYGEYFTHGLGHGVGLEIHEYPILKYKRPEILEAGMVVTVEPGIYLPGLGGVRLEDSVLITETGYESLTNRPLSQSLPIVAPKAKL